MKTKLWLSTAIGLFAIAAVPVYGQSPFPAKGDDSTDSRGSFAIQVNKKYWGLFTGCPGYSSTTHILQSPVLVDTATVIGRSDVLKEDSPDDAKGVPVGTAGTVIGDKSLSHIFPAPKGTRELHTEIHSLKMVNGPVMVRAGVWYNNPSTPSAPPPAAVSGGEVKSQSGNSGNPKKDFPARSFFDVYVQIDLPACAPGKFPGGTLFNRKPLIVKAQNLTQLPPKVVYVHDASIAAVPILFAEDQGKLWHKNQVVGCVVLAGHGVGVSAEQFTAFMRRQRRGQCSRGIMAPPGP